MFKSFKLFKLFGVDIKVHWSWLIIFILFIDFKVPISEMLISALSVVVIFTFVLIHEFGHIFAARKYGVGCKEVILSLLGGVAMVDASMADLSPKKALWVTFAGPLTNLVMFFILFPFFNMVMLNGNGVVDVENIGPWQMMYIMSVAVNAMMFIFNLLPIYPMDGGRLLRSTMELFNVKNSLIISIRITQVFCIAIIVLGIYLGSWTMPLIGGLFLFTSYQELKERKGDGILDGLKDEKKRLEEKLEKNRSTMRATVSNALAKCDSDKRKLQLLDAIEENTQDSEELKNILDEFRRGIK